MKTGPGRFGRAVAAANLEYLKTESTVDRVHRTLFEKTETVDQFDRFDSESVVLPGFRARLIVCAAALVVSAVSVAVLFYSGVFTDSVTATLDGGQSPVVVGEWIEVDKTARRLDFSEGSTIRLSPRSGIRVVSTSTNGAVVSVERGTASVDIVHREGTQWRFSAGPFSILVVGTAFNITWFPESGRFSLELVEGEVEIFGSDSEQRRSLYAGETFNGWSREGRMEIVETGDGGATSEEEESGDGTVTLAELRQPDNPAARESQIMTADKSTGETNRGVNPDTPVVKVVDTVDADAVLGSRENEPESRDTAASPSAGEWLATADGIRLEGDKDEAEERYLRIRQLYPGTKSAVLAAFSLGAMAFDLDGDYKKAFRWFEIYISEQKGSGPVREARGRVIESLYRLGDFSGAAEKSVDYLGRYPDGPHAPLAKKLAGDSN